MYEAKRTCNANCEREVRGLRLDEHVPYLPLLFIKNQGRVQDVR
jgi:hypothetical protein